MMIPHLGTHPDAPPPTRRKPEFIEAAEIAARRFSVGMRVRTVSLRELDALIGRAATDALVSACGGFHLPVPSPGQKCEIAETILGLIGDDAAKALIYTYANTSIYIPVGRA